MLTEHDQIAEALPRYEIEGELGRGGWGVVLGGRHRQLDRQVAIKQLPTAFARNPEVRERFMAEARVLASLDHPHVVPVYDYYESEELCLLVMEKLPGGTVWSKFTSTGLAMPVACAVVMAACAGLHCAHQHGVFHRDVKPENLMFSATGTLKVTDFGIAKVLNGSTTKATRVGEVLGTPAYIAPEQVKGEEITPATDVYATGVMLYELLSGHLPFPEDDEPQRMLYRHGYEPPQHISEVAPQVPASLADVTMWALETSPADRCPTAEDLSGAVAEAAEEAWGTDWLSESDVPVMATTATSAATTAGRIRRSGERTASGRGTAAPATRRPSLGARRTSGAAPPTARPERPPVPAPPPSAPIRPVVTAHAQGAKANQVEVADLVPVQEVVPRPPSPALPWLSALALLLVTVAVAFIGVGSPARTGGDARPGITVGTPDDKGDGVIDLSQPVPVTGAVVPEAGGADTLELALAVDKLELAKATAPLGATGDGRFSTSFDLTGRRFLVAGRVAAQLRFLAGGQVVAERSLPVKTANRSLLTVPGGVALALLLVVFAYAESILKSMRRGRKRVSGPPGLAIVGALAGVLAVAAAWVAGDVEVTRSSLVVCALLGAASALAAAWGARRLSRRRPVRRLA